MHVNTAAIAPGRFQHVSKDGLRALGDRLAALEKDRNSLRNRLIELRQIKDAEEFDLVDDSLQLDFLDKEIANIKYLLAHSKVRQTSPGDGTVQMGSVVRLKALGKEMSCVLVSELEANPAEGKISDKSPLGNALLGKMANALVRVNGPHRSFIYRIMRVEPAA